MKKLSPNKIKKYMTEDKGAKLLGIVRSKGWTDMFFVLDGEQINMVIHQDDIYGISDSLEWEIRNITKEGKLEW